MTRLPDYLRQAARSRTERAEKRARTAVRTMVAAGEAISFSAVARTAAVSTDFLYGHHTLRGQIERHRAKHGPLRPALDDADTTSTSSAVRALSARLTEQRRAHQQEITELRKALEVAHGENLELRRRLAQHEPD